MSNVVSLSAERPPRSYRITVQFERRADGGLRAWCDEIPGFGLSHRNVDAVLSDVQPALEGILTYQLGERYKTTPLCDIRAALERDGVIEPVEAGGVPDRAEYVAQPVAA